MDRLISQKVVQTNLDLLNIGHLTATHVSVTIHPLLREELGLFDLLLGSLVDHLSQSST